MAYLLERYGYRVQKSVFEMLIDKRKFKKMISEIEQFSKIEDLIKVYQLKGINETYAWGMMESIEDNMRIFEKER